MRGAELGFQRDDARGRLGVIAAVHECEHRGDVLRIGGEDLGVLLVAVVRLVGQAEPGLVEVHQVARRVLGVGVDVDARAAADPVRCSAPTTAAKASGVSAASIVGQLVEQRLHTALGHGLGSSMKLAYRSPMRCSSVPCCRRPPAAR